jgi:hypothetical protein
MERDKLTSAELVRKLREEATRVFMTLEEVDRERATGDRARARRHLRLIQGGREGTESPLADARPHAARTR